MMRHQVVLAADANFDAWRDKARVLLAAGAAPEHVDWSSATEPGLSFDPVRDIDSGLPRPSRVPRQFVERARQAAMHRQFDRFALLYRILWRLTHHEPKLLELHVDADVVALNAMGKAVSRDLHKMKAFVRFKEIASQKDDGRTWFVAWFEPEHFIVPAAAPFFVGRFTNMRFSIVTPDASMHWDGEALAIGPGGRKSDVPAEDASEELWRTYYASIFNPARLKLDAMRAEMPKKYWKNLPEASLIAGLSNAAMRRTADMIDAPPAEPNHRVPVAPPAVTSPAITTTAASKVLTQMGSIEDARQHLLNLTKQAAQCRSCELWRDATQTVFGEGPPNATVMLVGEQPGDQEDLAGHPFVGPAGQLLDRALIEAGVDRRQVYVTNAVKHFKFVTRGKRRLHQSPKTIEIESCSHWLERELELIKPTLVVALGATAVNALMKRAMPIKANRGRLLPFGLGKIMITVHPSYLLRLPDPASRQAEEALFVGDLKLIAAHLAGPHGERTE